MIKAEREYLSRVAELGCLCCGGPAIIHHAKLDGGIATRESNYKVIPLCPRHHNTGGYGVAYHDGPAAFADLYGTQQELLDEVDRRLGDGTELVRIRDPEYAHI